MHRQKPLILFCQILLALWLARTIPAEEPIRYDRDVRPILANHCFACHGPDAAKREGELRLDQPVAADRGIIVAGRPARSELIKRVSSNDPDIRMPPPARHILMTTGQWLRPSVLP